MWEAEISSDPRRHAGVPAAAAAQPPALQRLPQTCSSCSSCSSVLLSRLCCQTLFPETLAALSDWAWHTFWSCRERHAAARPHLFLFSEKAQHNICEQPLDSYPRMRGGGTQGTCEAEGLWVATVMTVFGDDSLV